MSGKKTKRLVYTSIPNYVQLGKGISVRNFIELSCYQWACSKMVEMESIRPSFAEEKFLDLCRSFRFNFFRQVFFQIDGKIYFLDFFLATKNIAVEIDGKGHQKPEQQEYDKIRDRAFLSIGIKTIRFTTEEIRDPDFYQKYYYPRLQCLNMRLKRQSDISDHQKALKRAIRTLEMCKANDSVEFQSCSMPFIYAVSKDHAKRDSADYPLLCRFYELKKGKNIRVLVRFIGQRENMKKGCLRFLAKHDLKCDKVSNKLVVVI